MSLGTGKQTNLHCNLVSTSNPMLPHPALLTHKFHTFPFIPRCANTGVITAGTGHFALTEKRYRNKHRIPALARTDSIPSCKLRYYYWERLARLTSRAKSRSPSVGFASFTQC